MINTVCTNMGCSNYGKLAECSKYDRPALDTSRPCRPVQWHYGEEIKVPTYWGKDTNISSGYWVANDSPLELIPKGEEIESDGGSTDYYKLPKEAHEVQDLIEFKDMNFSLGNIFKAVWRLGTKKGASKAYDLRKIIWYASRELAREEGKYYRLVECTKEEFHGG